MRLPVGKEKEDVSGGGGAAAASLRPVEAAK